MEYTHLGRTGLKVSRLCLGTMNFGPHTSEADAFRIMDRALELGINFFDTANVYGWKTGRGRHRADHRALVRPGRRPAREGRPRHQGLRRHGRLAERAEALGAATSARPAKSRLRRLQTDHIDLYQMHHVDRETPWEEIWQAMEVLVGQGKVIYVGSSNFAGVAHRPGATRPPGRATSWAWSREQSLYNLMTADDRAGSDPGLPRLRAGRHPLEPAGGRPAGRRAAKSQGRPPRRREAAGGDRKAAAAARSMRRLLQGAGREAGRRRAGLAAAQPGRDRADHRPAHDGAARRRAARAGNQARRGTALQKLDEIWPGPGGEAPEAYAW